MRRLRLLGLMLLAVFSVAVMASAAASAATILPKLLNAKKEASNAKVEAKENTTTELQVLGANTKVKCTSLESTAELNLQASGGYLGLFHIEFKECSAEIGGINAGKCTGTGDATGNILVLGDVHLVFDSLTTLGVAALFLLEPPVKFACKSIVTINLEVKGSVLCLISPINALAKESTLKCEQEGGDQKETKWSSGKEPLSLDSTALLLTSENGGEFKDSAQGGTVKLKNTPEVEIMG